LQRSNLPDLVPEFERQLREEAELFESVAALDVDSWKRCQERLDARGYRVWRKEEFGGLCCDAKYSLQVMKELKGVVQSRFSDLHLEFWTCRIEPLINQFGFDVAAVGFDKNLSKRLASFVKA